MKTESGGLVLISKFKTDRTLGARCWKVRSDPVGWARRRKIFAADPILPPSLPTKPLQHAAQPSGDLAGGPCSLKLTAEPTHRSKALPTLHLNRTVLRAFQKSSADFPPLPCKQNQRPKHGSTKVCAKHASCPLYLCVEAPFVQGSLRERSQATLLSLFPSF